MKMTWLRAALSCRMALAQQTPFFDSFTLAHQHANVRQMTDRPGEG